MHYQFVVSGRYNLHDNLCIIEPPVISFFEESLLNVPLYGSDEFNDKVNIEILLRIISNLALMYAELQGKLINLRYTLGDVFSYVLLLVMTFLVLFSSNYLSYVNSDIEKNEFDIVL